MIEVFDESMQEETKSTAALKQKPNPKPGPNPPKLKHEALPKWFVALFPLISSNEVFRDICDAVVRIYWAIRGIFLVQNTIDFVLLIWMLVSPAAKTLYFSIWYIGLIFLKPVLHVVYLLACATGVYKALGYSWHYGITSIDKYGDKLLTILGKLYEFIRKRWGKIVTDIKTVYEDLCKEAKEVLKTVVRICKRAYKFLCDIFRNILPKATIQWIVGIASIAANITRKNYIVCREVARAVVATVQIVEETWNEKDLNPKPQVCGGRINIGRPALSSDEEYDTPS